MFKKYDEMDLKDVLIKAKNNDKLASRYLIKRYQSMIHTIINRGLFLKNGDRDDLFAEGLIGLSRAIKDFDDTKGNAETFQKNLENFFYMCIYRAIISAIKSSNRKKNLPLNNTTSLDQPLQENDNLTIMDIIASRKETQDINNFEFSNPEEQLILEESINTYKEALDKVLSDKEKDIYKLRLKKMSYKEMQEELGYDKIKPIDNALQRIKIKLNQIIEEDEEKTNENI